MIRRMVGRVASCITAALVLPRAAHGYETMQLVNGGTNAQQLSAVEYCAREQASFSSNNLPVRYRKLNQHRQFMVLTIQYGAWHVSRFWHFASELMHAIALRLITMIGGCLRLRGQLLADIEHAISAVMQRNGHWTLRFDRNEPVPVYSGHRTAAMFHRCRTRGRS